MIQYDQTVCRNLDLASRREWLETNGFGGFASSTIAGLNTRRYHGLLIASTRPPLGRMLLLAKLEETLIINGRRYELSANRYPGVIHPRGFEYLKQFRLDPFPVFVYEVEGLALEKSVFMVHGENTTVVEYRLRGAEAGECLLEVRPLIAFRDYHSTTHENTALNPSIEIQPGFMRLAPYEGLPPLFLSHTAAKAQPAGYWYRNFEYTVEQERGLDYREDLFNPVALTFDLALNQDAAIVASTDRRPADTASTARQVEIKRRNGILAAAPSRDPFVQQLTAAADQFIVKRGDGSTIIAGYPWFTDWGRDTMIALPGLTLATGRSEIAEKILLAFAGTIDRGMLPNRFPDAGETPEYNSADSTLWFFEAIRALAAHTGDLEFVRARLYATLTGIIDWHERGTRHAIHVDADGLLSAGEPGVALTWMDARVDDQPVTPRYGKPVEIQALWYNALRIMEEFAEKFGDDSRRAHYRQLADRAKQNFPPLFWNAAAGCLYDVVNADDRDSSIRPNQIFAVSLPHTMLSPEQAKSVVDVTARHLLTPYGLRTLSPADPQYHGQYGGDPQQRDRAYHQGTVWPWLLGPFIDAYLTVNGNSAKSRQQAGEWLAEFGRFIENEGVGQIPEVFSGDAPHRPAGCIAQAWSVAELLRLSVSLTRRPEENAA